MEVLTDLDFVNNVLQMDKENNKTRLKQLINSLNKMVKQETWELAGTVYNPTE